MTTVLEMMPNSIFSASGYLLDVPGHIEVVKHCPLERLVLETDAPYLSFDSTALPQFASKVAGIKGITVSSVLKATTENCKLFYGIPRMAK